MCADGVSENALNLKLNDIKAEALSAPFFIVFLYFTAMTTSFGVSLGQSAASETTTGATSGLLGTLFGGWTARRQWKYQKKQMKLQQQYALEQMAEQARLQREMFDYENEYNSPVNVFNRFRQAGINPAAVLGSSGSSMSATLPMPSAPSGGHVSGGPAIGSMPSVDANSVAASQVRLNNAAAENQQASAELSDQKAVTERSVRNMLAATVDEKVQNAYFTKQRSIYQELTNAKTSDMLDAQVNELRAHADQLVASGKLSQEQVALVREQAVNVYFDSQLKKAQTDTQAELAKYYRAESGFVSLQAEDLDYNIQSLSGSNQVTTYTMDKDGKAVPVTYTVDGYTAKRLSLIFGSMRGAAVAAREAIRADWENPNQWNQAIDLYWDNINGTAAAAAQIIRTLTPLKLGSSMSSSFVGPDGEFLGGSTSYRVPYRP